MGLKWWHLFTPEPLYEYLRSHGYGEYVGEAIMIEGWAVQFLPVGNPLIEEALLQAVTMDIKGVQTRAFTREHLMAICLQTGRPKDLARLVQFVEEANASLEEFEKILKRYNLFETWIRFRARFLPQ